MNKQYHCISGIPCTLMQLIVNHPEWAVSRIKQLETIEDEMFFFDLILKKQYSFIKQLQQENPAASEDPLPEPIKKALAEAAGQSQLNHVAMYAALFICNIEKQQRQDKECDPLIEQVCFIAKDVLKGIDKTETESEAGWWETSAGAKFGKLKLLQLQQKLLSIKR